MLDLEVFSDCKSLVTLINSNASSVALKSLLYDISVLSRKFSSISFTFIPPVNNVVADGLNQPCLLFVTPPSWSNSVSIRYKIGGDIESPIHLYLYAICEIRTKEREHDDYGIA
ncbi:hypothetical protein DY000_02026070 [Brassica cretica]|uniref:RNase H type-1 domain-containing protein n=1 Tax=Brassica cretica TaxID=69181 RepID=A0ABQ7E5L5_BRACR|nr:hypothetical protein DY000_02026070 [Brassica cretica]